MEILETHRVGKIEKPIRLQEYARGIFKVIPSRSGIKKAIKRRQVLVNGHLAHTGDWMQEGQEIVLLQPEKQPDLPVFKLSLPIVWEDDYFAIVDKPAGYACSGNFFRTIEHALPYNLKSTKQNDALAQPVVVHRLDNPTSGLLIAAKTISINRQLNTLFERGEVNKHYEAFVEGSFPETEQIEFTIEGKKALTHVLKIENGIGRNQSMSRLELNPVTGRTHQLRRHLSQSGHPIVGDQMYGANVSLTNKIALCASKLSFKHPVSQKDISVKAPKEVFKNILK